MALAPDLDPRFERLYGYLHDDVSRRRASAGLALELAGRPGLTVAGAARARLGFHGPLVAGGLLLVEDPDRPFLTRSLRVPDRVAAHLLGDDAPDASIADLLVAGRGGRAGRRGGAGARRWAPACPLVYIRQRAGASGRALARAAFAPPWSPGRGRSTWTGSRATDDPRTIAAAPSREARLLGGGLIVGPDRGDRATGARPPSGRSRRQAPPVVLVGSDRLGPGVGPRAAAARSRRPCPSPAQRHDLWVGALNGDATVAGFDPAIATLAFRLDPEQVGRAAQAAHRSRDRRGSTD